MVAALAAGSVQAAPLPGFSLTAQTPHFTFYTRDNQKVDSQKAEAYVTRIERLLGQTLEGRADYYRYTSPEQLAAGTGTYAAGVTFPATNQIHSTQEFHAHEIVHLVASRLGNPGLFFQEGLAVALGNDGKWNGQDVHAVAKKAAGRASLSRLVASFERMDPEVAYPLAGSFVASLIKAHGLAKVASFFRACSTEKAEVAFAGTFGQSLDEAGAGWVRSL